MPLSAGKLPAGKPAEYHKQNTQQMITQEISERLAHKDWPAITGMLHDEGYAVVKNVLSAEECRELIAAYEADIYRKTVVMERYRFGKGEYKYFRYPLPELISGIRESVYARIVPVANDWMQALNISTRFPLSHEEMKTFCHNNGQNQATILILKYTEGGYNTLHQDIYGAIFFPIQLVLFLNQPEVDYTGGSFVITEQVPRAQSKVNVLQPGQGDMLLFTTNFRPAKGKNGHYKVTMKHGVSPLHSGNRYTLGIIFHDALS
jgi:hypothetical protein